MTGKWLILLMLLASATVMRAQSDEEYRMEVGVGIGTVSYEGDLNGSITSNMQPFGSVLVRKCITPFMGLRAHVGCGKLTGNSNHAATYYPGLGENPLSFSHTLVDVGGAFEYNFWPYGTGRDYRGAKRCTPFVFGGLGATCVSGGEKFVFTGNVPLGLGVKLKMTDRLNAGIEWAVHFSLSDNLDGIVDPYGFKATGLFKNKDAYSALQLTLTYSFMPRCRTCHNADE